MPLALSLAFLAGACGLSFEVLWVRLLTIEAGAPLAAFTIVVCSFMLGLAAGALWLGRIADRSSDPLRLFGWLMAGTAALGAAGSWRAASGGLVRPILLWLELGPGDLAFSPVKSSVAGACVTLPALLLGGTLPLLLKGAGVPRPSGRQAGTLASCHAAGSAAGSLVCGFALLPLAGLSGSLLATSAGTLLAGVIALAASRFSERDRQAAAPARRSPDRPGGLRAPVAPVVAVLVMTGAAATALEVVWTRLATLSFGSSVQAASLVLAAVIAGLSLGNAVGARLATGAADPRKCLAAMVCGAALSALATDPLLGRLPLLAARLVGWIVPSDASAWSFAASGLAQFGLMFSLVSIPSLFLGAAFPVGCSALSGRAGREDLPFGIEGRTVGIVSAALTVGYLLGAPLAFFGIVAHRGSRACLLSSAAGLALAALASPLAPTRAMGLRFTSAITFACTVAAATFTSWDTALLSSGPYMYGGMYGSVSGDLRGGGLAETLRHRGELIYAREGADALVTVRRLPGGLLSLQVNGKTDASTGGDLKTQLLAAHLPLLLHGSSTALPRRVLVIGLGSGITVGAALAHPVESVEVVEISPEVAQAAALFEPANRGALSDPRTRLVVGDARARLIFGGDPGVDAPFDVIASQPSNPWIAGQAILFTREFFALARRHLSPHGIMCQWVQGHGLDPADFRSIVTTFATVFPNVSLWEESTSGGDYLLLGSRSPIAIDPADLAARISRPSVAEDLARVEIGGPAELLAHFVSADEALRGLGAGAPVQTEDRMALEFTAPMAVHRETLGQILKALEPHRLDPSTLAGGDDRLAEELSRRARAARKEREWAAGLGLPAAARAPDAELIRALSYLRAGMKAHALEALRDLTLRRPAERLPHLMLAHLHMSMGTPGAVESAVHELRRAVELGPDDARARLYLSRALYAASRLEEALFQNTEASLLDPGIAEVLSDRCAMMLAAGDVAAAEAACRQALSLDRELAEAHANLGVALVRRGRLEEAERSYRRALELDPGLHDARFNLAALFERRARGPEGLAVLHPLLSTPGGRDAEILRLAARLALQAGDRSAARGYLRWSLVLEPGNKESADLERMMR